MGKKYLSIEEAASILGMEPKELNQLREKGEVRAFADRGTWKFRQDDVDEIARKRNPDSDPEVPLAVDPDDLSETVFFDESGSGSDSEFVFGDDDETLGDQPTIIRKNPLEQSDSDVRLVFDENLLGSSGDVAIPDLGASDSDVKLVGEDFSSDPDLSGSDSDVKLVGADLTSSGSDSDVKLVSGGSDSDVAIVGAGDSDNVFDDEGGSFVLGGEDSGISLDMGDSGIALDLGDSGIALDADSGITLAGDSGISLTGPADSGIGLAADDDDDLGGTIPMMPSIADDDDELADTQMEVPMLEESDSDFEFSSSSLDDDSSTNVIMLGEEDEADDYSPTMVGQPEEDDDLLDDSVFDVADDDDDDFQTAAMEDDDLESDDLLGEDDELEEVEDIFGADDDDFDDQIQSGHSQPVYQGASSRSVAPVEAEWGGGMFAGLSISTLLMLVTGWVMYDVVRTMWNGNDPSGPTSALLDAFRGIFG